MDYLKMKKYSKDQFVFQNKMEKFCFIIDGEVMLLT